MSKIKRRHTLAYLQMTMSTREWNADTCDWIVALLAQGGYPLIEVPDKHRVNVEIDSFYEPDGDYDLEQERADLASGKLTAYSVLIEKECDCGTWNVVESLSGVVVETCNADNLYDTLSTIPDEYLTQVAAELITELEH